MRRFVIRRVIQSIGLLWLVMTVSFFLVYATPGGPELTLLSNPNITQEQIAAVRQSYGLDDPLYVQYGRWLGHLAAFDFGTSYSQGRPILELIGQRLLPTIQLGLFTYLIGVSGIAVGIFAARKRGRFTDNFVRVGTVIGSAMPHWTLALLILIILSNTTRWFPQGEGKDNVFAWFIHLLIPAAILSTDILVRFTRFVRSETLDVLGQDYVRTAHAKGLSQALVLRRHVLPNVLIPVITLLGVYLPRIISGAVIIEQIFNWPGMGRLFLDGAYARDYPLVLAILLLGTFLTIVGTLLADITYGLVDPRVQYS
jgi:peptide/nickel transport system permease protein